MSMINNSISLMLCICILCLMSFGCMSDKEYQLRSKQFKNQIAHQQIFDVFSAEGPVTIEIKEGGKVIIRTPNQPFQEIKIPDGIKTQEQLVSHLIDIGAISVLGWKALENHKGNSKTTTTINNYGAQ